LNDLSSSLVNLALDRIVEIEESNNVLYIENSRIDFNEYFEDVIGVSVNPDMNPQKILISVKNELLPYIETKPLHGSQKIKERDINNSILSIEVIPNYELESLLLSFGERLEVIEPLDLREKLADRINKMTNNYK